MQNKLPDDNTLHGCAKLIRVIESITTTDLASLPLTKKGDKKSPNHKGVPETIECVECAKALKNL
ncbi:hypothetical protein A3G56_01770 [Candidatus Falkowbacteria bacterium RIFCSPLOWO2_12_FULL_45_10]|uniref:Uncharacterized protein n=2 Tax=Candidatus Falkowiibacteriota TaxID=1752728 RepID=A0A1F5RY06_9BACT|nr:MAG: hypothetical protein A3G56_01770 [Candidatus Falkowbacteria bacterium RIFCSPLOWO2_12_FULL_45_10]OGF20065.1 MAG: hypothetical protein A3I35_02245 [Candidatus Falkowbacteria bacterium RIFCSPLOWO2_02_FULL_45_15]